LFPTIEILPPENAAAVSSLIARLDEFQLAIFVSPSAAMRGHAMVIASRSWPKGLRVAAVGNGTASALEERGFHAVLAPTGAAGRGYLRPTPVFVPHPRIALAARKLDVREIVVTGLGDIRTVAEMAAFFAKVYYPSIDHLITNN